MLRFLIVQSLLLGSWVGTTDASPLSRGSQQVLSQPDDVETIVKAYVARNWFYESQANNFEVSSILKSSPMARDPVAAT